MTQIARVPASELDGEDPYRSPDDGQHTEDPPEDLARKDEGDDE